MGFLMELPELLEGRTQSKGVEIEVTAMVEARRAWDLLRLLDIRKRERERERKNNVPSSKDNKTKAEVIYRAESSGG